MSAKLGNIETSDEQELKEILQSAKADIARMLVNVQRRAREREQSLRNEIAVLKAQIEGRDKVFRLLEQMAGEANLGMRIQR